MMTTFSIAGAPAASAKRPRLFDRRSDAGDTVESDLGSEQREQKPARVFLRGGSGGIVDSDRDHG